MIIKGAVGGSSQERSLPWNAARSVNFFPLIDQLGKQPTALYGTPGLQLFGSATGAGRGGFAATNGRVFTVNGANLWELSPDGSTVSRGTLDFAGGIVTMDENGFQLAICDGNSLYIFTYATNTFAKVVNVNLPAVATVTFIDGYFVVNRVDSGIFQISGLYDGTSWAALDFATAESSPDGLLRVLNVSGYLWLFGTKTTEIWANTGASPFPFQRLAGGKMEMGILSPYTAFPLDNTALWVGRDSQGAGIVYRAEGYTPQRISTETVEKAIQAAPNTATLRSWTYQEEGHTFYMVTGGDMETSWVYDLATQQWFERAYLNEAGNYETHLGAYGFYGFNQQLVLDRRNGSIYTQDLDYFSDAGDELAHDRTFTHVSDENQRFIVSDITLDFETGVSTQTGNTADAQVTLFISRDGGKTWPIERKASIGRVGKYQHRVVFRRLGQFRTFTARVRVTDAVKVTLVGAYMNTGGA